jgi:hypothetical protein
LVYYFKMDVAKTFRFDFSSEMMKSIERFSIVHQYDDRKIYKELWKTWEEDNANEIEEEIQRLIGLGYVGDIKDKMFKAGRYYFRKKNIRNELEDNEQDDNNDEKKNAQQEKKARGYITMNPETLKCIDNHISKNLCDDENFKPSEGYADFCKGNVDILRIEIRRMISEHGMNLNDVGEKIKKTYKNRYYKLIK